MHPSQKTFHITEILVRHRCGVQQPLIRTIGDSGVGFQPRHQTGSTELFSFFFFWMEQTILLAEHEGGIKKGKKIQPRR